MKKRTLVKIQPYVWLLPSVILMVTMILIPIISVFKISFSEVGRSGIVRGLNGVQNYLEIFEEPVFWHTLQNTIIWTVVVFGVSTVFGFVLAMVLNQEFHGRKFVRAVVIFPWATALVIQSVIWKYIINADYGSLNVFLKKIGLIDILKSNKSKSDAEIFDRITDYLTAHLNTSLTIEQICKDNLIGRSQLQKLFKYRRGLGVIEYFSLLKINAAKEMIRTNNLNFTQISEQLGFSSIHYFSRKFKQITGMTPSEYALSIKALAEGQF